MWYKTSNEELVFTPAVLVYPDRIEENIRRMIAIAGSTERLRPHVKTHKIAEIIRLQVNHGIKKFKCATLTEVEMVAGNGGLDILLAYPLLGPDIKHFIGIMKRYPDVQLSVILDSLRACRQLCDQAGTDGQIVNVFVDIDNGMHRTGIEPGKAGELIDFIMDNQSLSFLGLHIYDGHILDRDLTDRKAHCDRDFEEVNSLVNELEAKGIMIEELACGGTPTFPIHALYESRTLCPGTTIFWDAGHAKTLPDLDFLNAAVVAGRVICKPMQNVCFNLGHKSIASEMPHPRLDFLELKVTGVLNHSEEHLVVSTEKSEDLSIGDLVYALPEHVCPTIALHEKVYVVENQKVVDTWEVVARKRTYHL